MTTRRNGAHELGKVATGRDDVECPGVLAEPELMLEVGCGHHVANAVGS